MTIPCTPLVIRDAPAYPHRGLMLDTARHFLPVATITAAVDAMAMNKMNVLHLHLVDAQSFPVESSSYPNLTAAAYSPQSTYSHADLAGVVAHAAARGIRVVPEFDVPGHAYGWRGYDILAQCPTSLAGNINNFPLDPTKDLTVDVVKAFLQEMLAVFPDRYMHLGGDEIVTSCWRDDPSIASWMQQRGWADDYGKLFTYFVQIADGVPAAAGRTPLHWYNEYTAAAAPSGAIFQAWHSDDLQPALATGHDVIFVRVFGGGISVRVSFC